MISKEDLSPAQENDRLRRENRILKEEREVLKKATVFFCEPKSVRFKFIEEHRSAFSIELMCRVMAVSPRSLWAYRSQPGSCRQRSDLVTLAHIKEQSRLSLESYGRPRMMEELKEIGLDVGHRGVGWLMCQNGISVMRLRKHRLRRIATTSATSRRTCWIGTSRLNSLIRNGQAISATYGRAKVGCIWP